MLKCIFISVVITLTLFCLVKSPSVHNTLDDVRYDVGDGDWSGPPWPEYELRSKGNPMTMNLRGQMVKKSYEADRGY